MAESSSELTGRGRPNPIERVVLRILIAIGLAAAWVTAFFDRRVRSARPGFPINMDQLADQEAWCLSTLQRASVIPDGALISSFEVARFAADKSLRSHLARIRLTYEHDSQSHEFSCLAKFAPMRGSLHEHAVYVLQDNASKECGFYTRCAPALGPSVPEAYFARADKRTGHFLILLEEVTGSRYFADHETVDEELPVQVAATLGHWHAMHWDAAADAAHWQRPISPVVIDYFATRFDGPHKKTLAQLMRLVWNQAISGPQTLIHGDARLGNWLFQGKRAVLFDWQALRWNRAAFDLAYFGLLSMDKPGREAAWPQMKRAYLDALKAGSVAYNSDDFDEDCRFAECLSFFLVTAPLLARETSSGPEHVEGLRRLGDAWNRRLGVWLETTELGWLADRAELSPKEVKTALVWARKSAEDAWQKRMSRAAGG